MRARGLVTSLGLALASSGCTTASTVEGIGTDFSEGNYGAAFFETLLLLPLAVVADTVNIATLGALERGDTQASVNNFQMVASAL